MHSLLNTSLVKKEKNLLKRCFTFPFAIGKISTIALEILSVSMSSVNKVILVGNLGQDPEIRMMPDGNKMASFSVATSERWKDKTGEVKSITEWHRVVIFNPKLAETLERLLKKGKRVYVEGNQRTRKWVDKEGREQRTTEVIVRYQGTVLLLESKSTDSEQDFNQPFSLSEDTSECHTTEEDEIPF